MQVIPYVGDSSDGTTIFTCHFMNIIFDVVLEITRKNFYIEMIFLRLYGKNCIDKKEIL